jgi:hypothetical protein
VQAAENAKKAYEVEGLNVSLISADIKNVWEIGVSLQWPERLTPIAQSLTLSQPQYLAPSQGTPHRVSHVLDVRSLTFFKNTK